MTRKITILFSLLILYSFCLFSQVNQRGIPFIKYYSPKLYDSHPFNWAMAQDNRGIMYFGCNNKGILEYDGITWRKIAIPNNNIIRSLAVDKKGTVYVGSMGEFGMLLPDSKGNLKYVSLSAYVDTSVLKKINIWKTYATDDGIYFCANAKYFKYTPQKSIEVIPLAKRGFWSFFTNDHFYTGNDSLGLMMLKDNTPTEIPGGDFFKDKSLTFIHADEKNKLIIGEREQGLFSFDLETNQVTPYFEKPGSFMIYNGCRLNEHNYAIATLNQGVMLFNKTGFYEQFTSKMGINTVTITDAFAGKIPDFLSSLWITSDNGIYKAEINSPFCKMDSEFGLDGEINDIIKYKDVLYVAASTGVYFLDFSKGQIPAFTKITAISSGGLSFYIFKTGPEKDILLVGTENSLFQLEKNNIVTIDANDVNIYDMAQSTKDPSLLFTTTEYGTGGVKIKSFNNGKWTDKGLVQGISENARQVIFDNDGNLWVATLINGIYKVSPDLKTTTHYTTKNGFKSDNDIQIKNIDGNILLGTITGIFKYKKETDNFIPDGSLSSKFASGKVSVIGIYEGLNHSYWMRINYGTKEVIEKITKQENGNIKVDSIPFMRLPNMIFKKVINTPDGITWIASSEGLYSYDNNFNKNYKVNYFALIRSVVIGEDSTLFNGTYFKYKNKATGKFAFDSLEITTTQPEELKPVLAYKNNNLTFTFAAPFFEDENATQFSRFLEGNDEGWSKWKSETKAIYTNLPEGNYTFHVKARNIFGIESKVASYSFTVKPPWYRTIWAYISYIVLLVLLIWGIVSIATYRMKQLNIAYGRYLPGSFLKLLDKARVIDLRLGDITEKEVTIMFSDIRSYTNLSESMKPHDNFRFLVSYLGKIGDMLHQNTGFPVQYYGDGIMAMFHGDTDNAVQAAVDMHNKVAEYSKDRIVKDRRELHIGVGLHTGKIVMGIRGDARRWEGGIVGDSVNLAARMEGLTKMYGASTMLTDDTFSKLKNPKKFNIRFLGKVKVKGKDIPVGIYELLDGLYPEPFNLKMKTKVHFDAALDYFFEKDLEKAKDLFTSVTEENPNDIAALHYLEIIKHLLIDGIPNDFDGVEKLDKK